MVTFAALGEFFAIFFGLFFGLDLPLRQFGVGKHGALAQIGRPLHGDVARWRAIGLEDRDRPRGSWAASRFLWTDVLAAEGCAAGARLISTRAPAANDGEPMRSRHAKNPS